MDQHAPRARRTGDNAFGPVAIDFGGIYPEDVGALLGQIELLSEQPPELHAIDADAVVVLSDAISRALTGDGARASWRSARPEAAARRPGYVFA